MEGRAANREISAPHAKVLMTSELAKMISDLIEVLGGQPKQVLVHILQDQST